MLAGVVAGWRMGLLAAAGVLSFGILGVWDAALETMALLLIAVTLAVIGLGTLIGWIFGAAKAGLIAGVVLGVPAGVGGVYVRYRGAFS
jgi:ABC-type proline/glycine betaine transport system permease subunit